MPSSAKCGHQCQTDCSRIARWAVRMPDMGPAVYRVTNGTKEHKHSYHVFCPWSPDRNLLLLGRYDRVTPDAEICVMDVDSGEIRSIGTCVQWNSHSLAQQQWLGNQNRIMYRYNGRETDGEFMVAHPDGSDKKHFAPKDFFSHFCSLDGKWVYGATPLPVMFPDDKVSGQDAKGFWRFNIENGTKELLMSVADAIRLHPGPEAIEKSHLHAKNMMVHPVSGRLLLIFSNTFWAKFANEPKIGMIVTTNPDGSSPAYLGRFLHHPNWHPVEDSVIANVRDCNNEIRFGFYSGNGSSLLEYVPRTNGTGHPTVGLDGKWICSDGKCGKGYDNSVTFCERGSGRELVVASFKAVSDGYAVHKAIEQRAAGESIIDGLLKCGETKTWQTQCHPAWSRDGSAVLFNRDAGDGKGSQLYMIDVAATLAALA